MHGSIYSSAGWNIVHKVWWSLWNMMSAIRRRNSQTIFAQLLQLVSPGRN